MVDAGVNGVSLEVREIFPVPVDVKVTSAPIPSAFRLTEAPVPRSTPRVSILIFPVPLDFTRIPPAPDEIKLISPSPLDKTLNVDAPIKLYVMASILAKLGELAETLNLPSAPKLKFVSPTAVWFTVKLLLISNELLVVTSVVKLGSAISGVSNIASSSVGAIFRTTAPVPVAVVTPVPPFAT